MDDKKKPTEHGDLHDPKLPVIHGSHWMDRSQKRSKPNTI